MHPFFRLSSLCLALFSLSLHASVPPQPRDSSACLTTSRADGRFLSTRGAVQAFFKGFSPSLRFRAEMQPAEFPAWRAEMSHAMTALMQHPEYEGGAAPKRVLTVQREGYRIEKWESYPLPDAVVPFLVLIPNGVDAKHPAPAATLCIPGFGQTKELLAGEVIGDYDLKSPDAQDPQKNASRGNKNAQALMYVKEGLVAVVVDNPSCGELMDLGQFDYLNTSRLLLEMGWSYLGLSSYQDRVVLEWLKAQPFIRRDRIILSGFSLGTEPLMALGLMDPTIFAFVYNDFLCTTRERILVMTKPDGAGRRPFPNSIEHLIPNFLTTFDFPDIVCALAPRPVICTEGGMDRDFQLIQRAFSIAGAPEAFTYHHYAAFADPSSRKNLQELPEGLDRTEFFRLVNCDPPHHYFKQEHVLPWLRELLKK